MLIIDGTGRVRLTVTHLREKPMETFDEIINRYANLDINLFYHVVSSPNCRYERRFGNGRVPDSIRTYSSQERLKRILLEKCITGNPKGYFVNKHKDNLTASQIDDIKSVSFTLCNIDDLKSHFEARDSEYCICFFHDFLLNNGLQKVVYVNDQNDADLASFMFNSPHLLEVYHSSYDMRWENEWRIQYKLSFEYDDIAFIVIPDHVCESMSDWIDSELQDGMISIIPSSAFKDPVEFLLMIPKLDSGWTQFKYTEDYVKICLDFDEFPELTKSDRIQLVSQMNAALSAIPKTEIQNCYEVRYSQRFLMFLDQLKELPIFEKFKNLEANSKEPFYSNVDLIKACYKTLHDIQSDRIYNYEAFE